MIRLLNSCKQLWPITLILEVEGCAPFGEGAVLAFDPP